MADPNLNGKIQVQGEIVPDGGSSLQPVTDSIYVTGTPQNFESIADLVAFHPLLLKRGQSAKVVEEDPLKALKITEFVLMAAPAR